MKKIFLFIIFLNFFTFRCSEAAIEAKHWTSIVRYIISNAENNNRNEFELAKQAFLNIREDGPAEDVARLISRKWKTNFPEADAKTLKSLKRYPNMTAADVKAAGEKLFRDHEGFINGAGEGQLNMNCRIP
ncbi:hypothetical protein [Candidatus Babela massiliensis]|uniref:Uncharacterized protein n=1 Tax=Candidatus Babela massiliensis TaxID=673862 RepID=V6DI77_9BACT|nr:hypothetical protein [Candidatus Babela massiliensis]CDK30633.1 hypothetical protein BABL1_gene_382 [Candidatus Babela massiliensis]